MAKKKEENAAVETEETKATGKWPDPAKAWEQADAAAKK